MNFEVQIHKILNRQKKPKITPVLPSALTKIAPKLSTKALRRPFFVARKRWSPAKEAIPIIFPINPPVKRKVTNAGLFYCNRNRFT